MFTDNNNYPLSLIKLLTTKTMSFYVLKNTSILLNLLYSNFDYFSF